GIIRSFGFGKGYESGGKCVSALCRVSSGRELWVEVADTPGGRLNSFKYSGRPIACVDKGIPEPSIDGAGLLGRGRDPTRNLSAAQIPRRGTSNGSRPSHPKTRQGDPPSAPRTGGAQMNERS